MKKMLLLAACIFAAMVIVSLVAFTVGVVFSLIFFAIKLAFVGLIGFALYRVIAKSMSK